MRDEWRGQVFEAGLHLNELNGIKLLTVPKTKRLSVRSGCGCGGEKRPLSGVVDVVMWQLIEL